MSEKIEEEKTKSEKDEMKTPLSYGWLPLGVGIGVKWTLWRNSVSFQRQEKQGDRWITLEEFHLAPKVLKEIAWRIPGWLGQIEKFNGSR